ncbi:hypothetical protein FK535_24420 [Mycolicibacterium sp. 018/SC-01/001]|uniref:Vgb family protein n=1 Tax=Mycolicibacterium sp. 018/SC-01/001 TaxID=2592069 RepID=UPI00117E6457|nr:hypothetical protein [Mycolicibacterium sp. 018/SC-01/001]TRW78710.1 hypothetical protein FK535_24420 [Mycolicibacterium sp. 018/SC-01/001]
MAALTVIRHPGLNAPSGIIAAAGDIWFTNIGDDRIGRVRDGRVELFGAAPGVLRFPANIFPGADGRVWCTSLGSDALVSIDPMSPDPASTITAHPLPTGSRPVALKSAPDGRLWFSLRGSDAIGSLDPRAADPVASLRVISSDGIVAPAALYVTSDGQPWWVNAASIGCCDPLTGDVTTIDSLPATPRAWTQAVDGALWLTTRDPAGLLSFNPTNPAGTMCHFTHSELVEPDGICTGVDGRLWFVDASSDRVVGVAPQQAGDRHAWTFVSSPDVRGPFDIKPGPDPDVVWFTNKAGNSLGLLSVAR